MATLNPGKTARSARLLAPKSTSTLRTAARGLPASEVLLGCAVLAMWLGGWAPSLLNLQLVGRGNIRGLEGSSVSSASSSILLGQLLDYGALALVILAFFMALPRVMEMRPGAYVAILGLWASVAGLQWLLRTGGPSTEQLFFPLIVLTWAITRPNPAWLYRLLAYLTVAMAVFSIGFALVSNLAFMPTGWNASADKAIIGESILAGPYSHSNSLGLSLALGLPFVMTQFKRRPALLSFAVTALALLWSASRTSIIISLAAAFITIVTIYTRERIAVRILTLGLTLSTTILVALPVFVTDPYLFTNRGLIWIQSFSSFTENQWTGIGPNAYRVVNQLTSSIGFLSTTGHNTFVTFATVGGILTLTLLAVAGAQMAWASRAGFGTSRIPLLFLVVLVLLCVVEDPIRALLLSPQSYVIFPMICVLLDRTWHGLPESLNADLTGNTSHKTS